MPTTIKEITTNCKNKTNKLYNRVNKQDITTNNQLKPCKNNNQKENKTHTNNKTTITSL